MPNRKTLAEKSNDHFMMLRHPETSIVTFPDGGGTRKSFEIDSAEQKDREKAKESR